jgi:glycosyltransferase 2 family protein
MNRTAAKWLLLAGTFVVSALFSYLAVRDVKWASTWKALEHSNYWWLIPAFAALAVSTFMRAIRWRSLFRREHAPAVVPVTKATLIGLFFNNILPARAGEAARIVALKSYGGISRAESTATVVVERLLDVLSLLALLFVLVPWFPHVSWLRAAAVVASVALGMTVVLVGLAVYLARRPTPWFIRVLAALPFLSHATVDRLTASVTHGFAAVRQPRQALIALAWTVASWLILGVGFWFLMIGFHLHLSVLAGILVVIAVGLSFIIPAAPGGLGVFEAAGLAATRAYGVPTSRAFAYVLVLHALNFLPYVLAGVTLLASEARGPRRRLAPKEGA